MEFMNFARQRKSDSLKKCSKAAARKSIAVMDKQSSESVVNLNIHDSASASKFSNHVNDPRRSSRQARQRITVNQPVEAADQRLLLAGSTFEAVREFISKSKEQKAKGERKKRGEYHRYTPEVKEAIAKHAIENGIRDASKSYSSSLG